MAFDVAVRLTYRSPLNRRNTVDTCTAVRFVSSMSRSPLEQVFLTVRSWAGAVRTNLYPLALAENTQKMATLPPETGGWPITTRSGRFAFLKCVSEAKNQEDGRFFGDMLWSSSAPRIVSSFLKIVKTFSGMGTGLFTVLSSALKCICSDDRCCLLPMESGLSAKAQLRE